ncbi:MAG TPA: sigma-70 family RNA polymerase sigma factor [Polyangiaceae bacterium]|jgi:RNA polymerase sigma factor for flagellar operon FliA|nr:sigma-70 family RNA polymerase sigma factor [Polyangiaceae bacterium]
MSLSEAAAYVSSRPLSVPPTAPNVAPISEKRARGKARASHGNGDSPEAKALFQKYQQLVRQIAGGFQRKLPSNVLRDDLIAAGMSGLWDAVRRQGNDTSGNFDWYVRVRIRGAILDELRAQDWLPRRARAAATEAAAANPTQSGHAPVVLRFDEVSETEQARCLARDDANAEETATANCVRKQLEDAMNLLPERERRIVSLHYFRGIKFKDLGEMLGVSEPRISQLHSRAMSRLKSLLVEAA